MVGYDGPVLAFVEVKTRAMSGREQPSPEEAVNADSRRFIARMARQFLRTRRAEAAPIAWTSWRSKPEPTRALKFAFTSTRSYLKHPDQRRSFRTRVA
jgi:hypothetical protein